MAQGDLKSKNNRHIKHGSWEYMQEVARRIDEFVYDGIVEHCTDTSSLKGKMQTMDVARLTMESHKLRNYYQREVKIS